MAIGTRSDPAASYTPGPTTSCCMRLRIHSVPCGGPVRRFWSRSGTRMRAAWFGFAVLAQPDRDIHLSAGPWLVCAESFAQLNVRIPCRPLVRRRSAPRVCGDLMTSIEHSLLGRWDVQDRPNTFGTRTQDRFRRRARAVPTYGIKRPRTSPNGCQPESGRRLLPLSISSHGLSSPATSA